MKKECESLYLNTGFKKRNFPDTKKQTEINFEDTPLFKSSVNADIKKKQLNLFNK